MLSFAFHAAWAAPPSLCTMEGAVRGGWRLRSDVGAPWEGWVLRRLLSTVLGALHARGLCALFSALGHGRTSSIDASRMDKRTWSWCARATLA